MFLTRLTHSDDGVKSLHCGQINLDKLQAISQTKGCYVGQEVYTGYMHKVGTIDSVDASIRTLLV